MMLHPMGQPQQQQPGYQQMMLVPMQQFQQQFANMSMGNQP